MIYATQMVCEQAIDGQPFAEKLQGVVDHWQSLGMQVEVQYAPVATQTRVHYTALIVVHKNHV